MKASSNRYVSCDTIVQFECATRKIAPERLPMCRHADHEGRKRH